MVYQKPLLYEVLHTPPYKHQLIIYHLLHTLAHNLYSDPRQIGKNLALEPQATLIETKNLELKNRKIRHLAKLNINCPLGCRLQSCIHLPSLKKVWLVICWKRTN